MTGRRNFLRWLTHGMGAVFAAVLGAPAAAYLLDPRNREGGAGDFRDVARLDELPLNQPREFTLQSVRRDSWTVSPTSMRIYLVRKGNPAGDNLNIKAYSAVCPHLRCSVNYIPGSADAPFQCPCHNGHFSLEGERIEPNPATRDMYTLEVRRSPENPEIIQVEYRNV
jgi:Rieske Fe-S protein